MPDFFGNKVVGLAGRTPPEPNGAEPEVVELLADLLEKAKNGDILAVSVVVIDGSQAITTQTRYNGQKRHLLVAGVAYLLGDLTRE